MAVLAVDIGGTKSLAALVDGAAIADSLTLATAPGGGPESWLGALHAAVRERGWAYDGAGFAVTGRISGGLWSALNRATLDIAVPFALASRAEALFATPCLAANDAQAAAYGEFAHGAGAGADMVFLTVSTGVGGGIVTGGRLVAGATGLAGHYGQIRGLDGERLEDRVSGRAIERAARDAGQALTTPEVFAAARAGATWAEAIVEASARGVAALAADIKMTLDPARIVIGGGVGLAPGYLDRVARHLEGLRTDIRPTLCRAALGANAGIIGIAALFLAENR